MRGGFLIILLPVLLPLCLLIKKMVMDDEPRWVIHVTIVMASICIPFGIGWYVAGEFLAREDIARMTIFAAVIFLLLNMFLYVADKLSEN